MRIIAGAFKGREVKALKGSATRPTTNRVREAWASTIGSLLLDKLQGIRVLDAFAGSGALGLEMLSRGAHSCLFCENNHAALGVLRENVTRLTSASATKPTVLGIDVLAPASIRALAEQGPYGLVLLDPPYALEQGKIHLFLSVLARTGALASGALISYEQQSKGPDELDGAVLCSACSPASLSVVSCKTYGTTTIRYYLYQ